MKNIFKISIFLTCLLFAFPVLAQQYNKDLSLEEGSVQTVSDVLVGKTIRIYATVTNNSGFDLSGVVKFYDENKQAFIGSDQAVSVISNKTDDVFVDWSSGVVGNHTISVRVLPWDENGDNPNNNKVTKTIFVDVDSDADGTGDRNDPDDDNDGVNDVNDAFPLDPNESVDTDGDGIGDNADTDDDNDGVPDISDLFPLDPNESIDSDGDGVGDNSDAFPSNPNESIDSDSDGVGDNSDLDNQNHGPIPQITTEKTTVSKGSIVTFNALQSYDPDGEIVSFIWDFDDGTTEEGVVIDHIFEKTGTYKVSLLTEDDKGETREGVVEIKVVLKWQLIALLIVTLLLILLIAGRKVLFSDKKTKLSTTTSASVNKRVPIKKKSRATPTRKKALPKRKK
ncbi:PKD domain-containing protein [Candidatus Peregrinibacteria bacterium]|nr:PKD domain-containing protein [Candidatus Peregrinibacteria bacterium]